MNMLELDWNQTDGGNVLTNVFAGLGPLKFDSFTITGYYQPYRIAAWCLYGWDNTFIEVSGVWLLQSVHSKYLIAFVTRRAIWGMDCFV